MNDRTDVFSDLVDRLMESRLGHDLIEVDGKQLARSHKCGTLARHEKHAFAAGNSRAQMGEGIAQPFAVNNSQRRNEVSFHGGKGFILLFHDRSFDDVSSLSDQRTFISKATGPFSPFLV